MQKYAKCFKLLIFNIHKMGKIEIEGMEFYAYHGHYKAEQIVGSRFIVDVYIETDLKAVSESDNLDDTVDYQKIYKIVKKEMETVSKLLEHIGNRIIKTIKNNFEHIDKITVRVSKINPPLGGKVNKVSIILTD